MSVTDRRVPCTLWTEGLEVFEGEQIHVEIERTDADEIALHTFIDGEGPMASTYWSREHAIDVARRLLDAAVLR